MTDLRPPGSCWSLTLWRRRNAGKAVHGLDKCVSSGSSVPTPNHVLGRGYLMWGGRGSKARASCVTAGEQLAPPPTSNSPTQTSSNTTLSLQIKKKRETLEHRPEKSHLQVKSIITTTCYWQQRCPAAHLNKPLLEMRGKKSSEKHTQDFERKF